MITVNFHSDAGDKPARAKTDQAEGGGTVWLRLIDGAGNEVTVFMPHHPDAFAAAQTMALAFNRLVAPIARKAV